MLFENVERKGNAAPHDGLPEKQVYSFRHGNTKLIKKRGRRCFGLGVGSELYRGHTGPPFLL
jgi:hypothetical protein